MDLLGEDLTGAWLARCAVLDLVPLPIATPTARIPAMRALVRVRAFAAVRERCQARPPAPVAASSASRSR